MKIISVIPLKKDIWKDDLTYFSSLEISVGDIVSVPIKKKEMLALVTSVETLKENKREIKEMDFNLRKVIANKGMSIFQKEFLDSIFETNKYFAQNKNSTVSSLIPNIFLEEYDKLSKIKLKTSPEKINKNIVDKKQIKTEKLLLQCDFEERISIYKTLIRESFARNQSIFMVVPTEFDIEKFTNHLSKGIEQFIFSLHSGMTDKKNISSYEKIIAEDHPVLIIGTPPFLSIPHKNIGTIILEHENSNNYKTIKNQHLDLRVFVEIYASKINAKLIIGDEMLRFETIARKNTEDLNSLYPLSFRLNFDGAIEIADKKITEKREKFELLTKKSIENIKYTLENKKSVFIFSLRKGLATHTVCRDCNETISCNKCGAPLVLYSSQNGKRIFTCNRCEIEIGGDISCSFCGSWNLMPLGIGTDTVLEEIKRLFPKEKVFKLDKESAKTKSGAKKIIKEFEENPGSILVGTEMTFFYLKNKVALSIISSLDSLWSIPSFKMNEKIIQIILSTINNTIDKLIIQTKNEEDPLILAIKATNLTHFVREELKDRENLNYPPYKRFIKIRYLGDKEQTIKARNFLKEKFTEYNPEIFSGFVPKLKDKYVTNALIKLEPTRWSLPEIVNNSSIDNNLLNKLLSMQPPFEVFVDPEDLL